MATSAGAGRAPRALPPRPRRRPPRSVEARRREAAAEGAATAPPARAKPAVLRVALLCGGPSAERGISLNSARSALDHLQSDSIRVDAYYLDAACRAWSIDTAQMYSNTPEDFDFKLSAGAAHADEAPSQEGGSSTGYMFESLEALGAHLGRHADLALPVMHGRFGEDGGVQALLEAAGVPFVGTGAEAARVAFDKYLAAGALRRAGFAALPSVLLEAGGEGDALLLARWFTEQGLDAASARVVVKPCRAGSSVGVRVCHGVVEAAAHAQTLREQGIDDRVVAELFAEGGREFTVIVLGGVGEQGEEAVSLLPTEVEILGEEGEAEGGADSAIFNYRRKYLPTSQVRYHTPPRFAEETTAAVRAGVARLFGVLGLRDMARVDGWVLPPTLARACGAPEGQGEDGAPVVVFSDVNLVSGMEQTSFLFQQGAEAGMAHGDILRVALNAACKRSGLQMPSSGESGAAGALEAAAESKQRVYVLFGGGTSERQVSLMSGTNAWLKLSSHPDVDARPFLLDKAELAPAPGQSDVDALRGRGVLRLPYGAVLRHTVEEVAAAADAALEPTRAAATSRARAAAAAELALPAGARSLDADAKPERTTLGAVLNEAAAAEAVVFIAVHGGPGEDGRLQAACEAAGVAHTGPGPETSALCMDKVATGERLRAAALLGRVSTTAKVTRKHTELVALSSTVAAEATWAKLQSALWPTAAPGAPTAICIKPSGDGCSTGVARLTSAADLAAYATHAGANAPRVPADALPGAAPHAAIELPPAPPAAWLLEPFIETDAISMVRDPETGDTSIAWAGNSRWVEVTVAVWGREGEMRALSPSVTVREMGAVLSLEEKFQGGTGINLTPPPEDICSAEVIETVKRNIEVCRIGQCRMCCSRIAELWDGGTDDNCCRRAVRLFE